MVRLFWISCLLHARPASAARRAASTATTPTEAAPDDAAANDAPANAQGPELPLCELTDAQREAYRARAGALPASFVDALPPHIDARSARSLQHVAAAWGARARIVGVEVDGVAITAAELDDALPLMTWTREVLARRALPDSAPADPDAPPDDAAAMAAITDDVAIVCEALLLRFAGNPRVRTVLSSVRKERRPVALGPAVGQLLVLCDEPATAEHLAKLPKGEAAAVARLRAALPAWERRIATQLVGDATTTAVPPQEMARRAWALAQRTMERVVRAGRYLAKGDAAQERLWRAYRPAKKAKTPAPTPTPDA
jgi:hypothetical protein